MSSAAVMTGALRVKTPHSMVSEQGLHCLHMSSKQVTRLERIKWPTMVLKIKVLIEKISFSLVSYFT